MLAGIRMGIVHLGAEVPFRSSIELRLPLSDLTQHLIQATCTPSKMA
jgi:hypothetical protein